MSASSARRSTIQSDGTINTDGAALGFDGSTRGGQAGTRDDLEVDDDGRRLEDARDGAAVENQAGTRDRATSPNATGRDDEQARKLAPNCKQLQTIAICGNTF